MVSHGSSLISVGMRALALRVVLAAANNLFDENRSSYAHLLGPRGDKDNLNYTLLCRLDSLFGWLVHIVAGS